MLNLIIMIDNITEESQAVVVGMDVIAYYYCDKITKEEANYLLNKINRWTNVDNIIVLYNSLTKTVCKNFFKE